MHPNKQSAPESLSCFQLVTMMQAFAAVVAVVATLWMPCVSAATVQSVFLQCAASGCSTMEGSTIALTFALQAAASHPMPTNISTEVAAACLSLSTITTNANTITLLQVLVFPYVNGTQWGAETPAFFDNTKGSGTILLPLPAAGPAKVVVAWLPSYPSGFVVGTKPPAGAVMSNIVTITVAPRAATRPKQDQQHVTIKIRVIRLF